MFDGMGVDRWTDEWVDGGTDGRCVERIHRRVMDV